MKIRNIPSFMLQCKSTRDVGSISNLGEGTKLQGHFFVKPKGQSLNIKEHFFVYCKILGGHVPPVPPVPMSLKPIPTILLCSLLAVMSQQELGPRVLSIATEFKVGGKFQATQKYQFSFIATQNISSIDTLTPENEHKISGSNANRGHECL